MFFALIIIDFVSMWIAIEDAIKEEFEASIIFLAISAILTAIILKS